jgi:hypothetical protein
VNKKKRHFLDIFRAKNNIFSLIKLHIFGNRKTCNPPVTGKPGTVFTGFPVNGFTGKPVI